MTKLLAYLHNLTLTVNGIVVTILAVLIGALVIMFKLQGTKLHAAQVALMFSKFDNAQAKQDASVDDAKAAYKKALADYNESK